MSQLHIYFFPLLAAGHMIPVVDMARQFARHDTNLKSTIVLTHLDAPRFRATIERDSQQGSNISIRQVTFPTAQVGLPDDCASLANITSPQMYAQFDEALKLLSVPVEQLLKEDRPDCFVSDFFFPWTADLATKLRIPRIAFHVTGFFPLCVHNSLIMHKSHIGSDMDTPFVVPGIPDVVTMTRRKLPNFLRDEDPNKLANQINKNSKEAEFASYGVILNSFKELERDYVEHYKSNICSKAWHVGPVSLCNTNTIDKVGRGGGDEYDKRKTILDWLSTKEPNSVVYVCYGTLSVFSAAQTHEIAAGLESCGRDFIWVVKNEEGTLPEGFEQRVGKRGLLIKSWAPQVLILEHESVGGFLMHCGWNSLLEGVTAGKPMITWPISCEHFDNENLVTKVLKIGVGVGSMEWTERLDVPQSLIKGEDIAKAVNEVMVGEESVEMRNRVKALSDSAKKAVEKDGSSYNNLDSLLEELRFIKASRDKA
ncbi:scopoletin glucosyltransferase [Phtheirospermum japonicum]|uniref:Glycosyltransferase n=1 Tax=Phtheirospermum japonicum TaxID=374723 RepID=A0A830CQZ3_9LAMI|nr:scopoletin glucosyltransferase [Phtheirospermum japonicum]